MDNAVPHATQWQPPRPTRLGLVLIFLRGVALALVYLFHVVPRLSVIPMDYAPANFQNNTAGYYDVLNISLDANSTEISQGYDAQLRILNSLQSDITREDGSLNLTILAKVEEVEKAYRILGNDVDRCVYDFDYLHTGIWKYLRCLFTARVRSVMGTFGRK